jgi:hypothetical protein
MFQETWLKKSALTRFSNYARKLIPGYSVFAKTTTNDDTNDTIIQVVTFVHGALAARSTQLELSQFAEECGGIPIREFGTNLQCIRTTDLFTDKKILFINLYQYQSSQHHRQEAMLQLLSRILEREKPHVHEILLGGDWNASLEPRIGYASDDQSAARLADARLCDWILRNQLNPVHTPGWTWEGNRGSIYPIQRSCLDFFVTKHDIYECRVHSSPDPSHDHRLVCIGIPLSLISPLPELQSTPKKGRLRMSKWHESKPESIAEGGMERFGIQGITRNYYH